MISLFNADQGRREIQEAIDDGSMRSIYGADKPSIPDGYEAVGFHVPVKGEIYLIPEGGRMGNPVLIIGKL